MDEPKLEWGLAAYLSVRRVSVEVVMKYETRGGGYRGYMIDYVEADPTPGTLLPVGEKIRVTVTVRYVLQSSEKGLLVLLFRDEEATLLELSVGA